MSKMKAAAIYPSIVERFSNAKKDFSAELEAHVSYVKDKHEYQDLLTRISWDLLRFCFYPQEISDWYMKYNIDDHHITTAVRKAYVEVFGPV